jgi:hypothetical protein
VFQAHTWPFEARLVAFPGGVGARGGPEQLIKMATGNFAEAYDMRPRRPTNGDTCASNNALDHRDRAAGPDAASRVLRSAPMPSGQ